MYISDTDLDNDLRAIADVLRGWDLLTSAAPRRPDSTRIRKTLDEMALDGAPKAPELFRYFELVEALGLDHVYGLVNYFDACTSDLAQEWRASKVEIELNIVGFVNTELVRPEGRSYFEFGKCLVPVAECEGWGYAVDCGRSQPGPVYAFDKFGNNYFDFSNLNEMVHALRLAYEGKSPAEGEVRFSDSVPRLDVEGLIEWV